MVGMTAIPTGSNPELSFQIRGGTTSQEVHADNAPKPSPAGTTPVSRGDAAQRLEPGLPQGSEQRRVAADRLPFPHPSIPDVEFRAGAPVVVPGPARFRP